MQQVRLQNRSDAKTKQECQSRFANSCANALFFFLVFSLRSLQQFQFCFSARIGFSFLLNHPSVSCFSPFGLISIPDLPHPIYSPRARMGYSTIFYCAECRFWRVNIRTIRDTLVTQNPIIALGFLQACLLSQTSILHLFYNFNLKIYFF